MPIEFKKIHVSESGQSVVVTGWMDSENGRVPASGEVSATQAAMDGEWYLNRAIVGPDALRGKGLGSSLLKKLLEHLNAKPDFKSILVEPGGYHNDLKLQVRFYTNNGFELDPCYTNVYRWIKKKKEAHVEAQTA